MKHNLLGIAATLGGGAAMIASDAFARVALQQVPLGEVIAGRGIVACLILGTAAAVAGHLRWHARLLSLPAVLRIFADISSGLFFIAAIGRMPIGNATAILQIIPLVTTLFAATFFGETVGWRRWTAGAVGLCGVLLILKPGTDGFTIWSLLAVGAMLCMATRDLATSRIEKSVPTLLIGTATAFMAGVAGLGLAAGTGGIVQPSSRAAAYLLASGVALSAGFICLVVAARNAEFSAVAPFRYFTLLWAIIIGYFAWAPIPDFYAWIGIAIVICAGLYAFARERALRRQSRETTAA